MTKDGRGWHGDHKGHVEAALKGQADDANNRPMAKDENPYHKQANDFLLKHGIRFRADWKSNKCPRWCDGKHIHRNEYKVSFSKGTKKLTLSFWNSFNDASKGITPTAYDVLAAIQKYDPGDIDNFISDFGYEKYQENDWGELKPNKKTQQTYKAVVKEWEKVNSFFSNEELEELQEIA